MYTNYTPNYGNCNNSLTKIKEETSILKVVTLLLSMLFSPPWRHGIIIPCLFFELFVNKLEHFSGNLCPIFSYNHIQYKYRGELYARIN